MNLKMKIMKKNFVIGVIIIISLINQLKFIIIIIII